MAGNAKNVENLVEGGAGTAPTSDLTELVNPGNGVTSGPVVAEHQLTDTSFAFSGLRMAQEGAANAHDAFMNGEDFGPAIATPLPRFSGGVTTELNQVAAPDIAGVIIGLMRADARTEARRLAERAGVDPERMLSLKAREA